MLWACMDCTARYSPSAPNCPQCGSTAYQEAPGGVVEEGAPVFGATPDVTEPAAEVPTKTKPAKADKPAAETTS